MADRKSSLPPARSRLVDLMQWINFGRIEDLHVLDGEPQFTPPPRIVREIKIGGENGPRPEIAKHDFVLRREVIEFFTHLDRLGDGLVCRIDVQHGLPFKVAIQEMIA